MHAAALYAKLISLSWRARMEYPVSFMLGAISFFVVNGSEIVCLWAIFTRFDALAGWSFPEVALLYGIAATSFFTAEAVLRPFERFSQLIKSGEFDRMLVRPLSTPLQVAAQELDLIRVGRILQGVAVLAWAFIAASVPLTFPNTLLLVLILIGAAFLFSG